jgi:hypothetical protein
MIQVRGIAVDASSVYVAAVHSNKLVLNKMISGHQRGRPVLGHLVINPTT